MEEYAEHPDDVQFSKLVEGELARQSIGKVSAEHNRMRVHVLSCKSCTDRFAEAMRLARLAESSQS